jgi:hypothetical protein
MVGLHAAEGGITGQNTAMVLRHPPKNALLAREGGRGGRFSVFFCFCTASIWSLTVVSWGWFTQTTSNNKRMLVVSPPPKVRHVGTLENGVKDSPVREVWLDEREIVASGLSRTRD